MRGLRHTLAGLAHRKGRSATIFVLATLATTAAVVGPVYARAVEESMLIERLTSATESARGVSVTVGTSPTDRSGYGELPPPLSVHDVGRQATALLRHPAHRRPIESVQTAITMPELHAPGRAGGIGVLAHRQDAWSHLRLTQGRFPTARDEIIVADRSRRQVTVNLGDVVTIAQPATRSTSVRVVGFYAPRDRAEPYWFGRPYFDHAVKRVSSAFGIIEYDVLESWFAAEETVLPHSGAPVKLAADFRLDPGLVRLDNAEALRKEQSAAELRLSGEPSIEAHQLTVTSALPSILDDVERNRGPVRTLVPLVAAQLVLLCWYVLFLAIAGAVRERAPEVALGKLRGFRRFGVYRIGLSEPLLLVGLAAPVGLALGLGLVRLAARVVLAAGVHVDLRPSAVLVWGLAVGGAGLAALLAARRTLSQPVVELLRQVPARTGRWRATAGEGVVLALACAALLQLLVDASRAEPSPLSLLAPGLIALVVGVAAARLVPALSRRAAARALGAGRIDRMLAHTQLSRRPAGRQTVLVVTVAIALFTFAVIAWDVGERQREARAAAELGAAAVYAVDSVPPETLVRAVRRADPSGRHAMAVIRTTTGYDVSATDIVAVDSARLPAVGTWPTLRGDVRRLAAALRPPARPPLVVHRDLVVDVTVDAVTSRAPLRFEALITTPERAPLHVDLGPVTPGRHRYRAPVAHCAGGCRVAGFTIGGATNDAPPQLRYVFHEVRGDGRPLAAELDRPGAWRAAKPDAGFGASAVSPTTGGLVVAVAAGGPVELRVLHADAPAATPAVLDERLGSVPRDNGQLRFGGLYGVDQDYAVVGTESAVPSARRRAVFVDLEYADRVAGGDPTWQEFPPRAEVWVDADAPPRLQSALTAAGLRVVGHQTLRAQTARWDKDGPTLALHLYLFAAIAAVLLGAGAVVVTAYIGAAARGGELAALTVAGVPAAALRRSLRHEYVRILAVAVTAGVLAGGIGAVAALPSVPMFTDPPQGLALPLTPGPWPLAAGLVAAIVLLGTVAVAAARLLLKRAAPDRVRTGVS